MKIVFNELGVITSYDFSEQGDSLRQGAVGNVLTAKFTGISNADYIASINFTRPDGSKVTNLAMSSQGEDEYKVKFNNAWYFAKAGNATLTIFLKDQSNNVIAQGQVQIVIEATDYDEDGDAPLANPMTTKGDIIVAGNQGVPTRLPKGSANQVLKMKPDGTQPMWADDETGVEVEANPTVPSGTTQTALTGLRVGNDYYNVPQGGGGASVQDLTTNAAATLTEANLNDLIVLHYFEVASPVMTGLDADDDFVRIKLSMNSVNEYVVLTKNTTNKYSGLFYITVNSVLYEIGVYYDGSKIYLRSATL